MSKIVPSIIILMFFMFFALTSNAGSFTCDGKIFTTGERLGPSRNEVREICGEPITQSTVHWVYIRDSVRYVLTFGGNGLLTGIRSTPAR